MAQKSVKKAPAKKAVAVKAPAKKAVAVKAPAKKTVAVKAPVTKPAVKATPVAVKAPVKKTVVNKPIKAAAKVMAAPVLDAKAAMAAPMTCASDCGCGCDCKKKCSWFCRFVKKLIIFVVIFALGFAAAKYCTYMHGSHKGPRMNDVFVNGCLDVAKIQCPEMAQKVAVADVNADGCISKDEFSAFKKEMRGNKAGCGNKCGMNN